jgi:hypothetical protein
MHVCRYEGWVKIHTFIRPLRCARQDLQSCHVGEHSDHCRTDTPTVAPFLSVPWKCILSGGQYYVAIVQMQYCSENGIIVK